MKQMTYMDVLMNIIANDECHASIMSMNCDGMKEIQLREANDVIGVNYRKFYRSNNLSCFVL